MLFTSSLEPHFLCRDDTNNKDIFTMHTVCIVHNWLAMTGQHIVRRCYKAVNILPNPLRAKVIITSQDVVIISIPLESLWKLIDFKTQGNQTLLTKVISHSIVVKGVITLAKTTPSLQTTLIPWHKGAAHSRVFSERLQTIWISGFWHPIIVVGGIAYVDI